VKAEREEGDCPNNLLFGAESRDEVRAKLPVIANIAFFGDHFTN
jgi:hypothetical protein